ncbi:hypothetical protein MCOR02_005247 [Pyricularia oryzae]|uniref:Uncharacterized protein n=1 Tax=Pyricularia oryzae TaxID=318829 RepID=A0A4P7NNV2_PYROR|nr:hypothetical protein MCOR02_005247 [Pyricularia oryzae]KAI6301350.1 hypothetical protein MCOR34_009001 [Pyricularia oryzae]KAI6306581.1 hypothetical protein MCOR29_010074 [Pyricularia oryzae]KAI6315672.1 hypothetical protein MCOR30_009586 [Pyricularia oryzae]KAI6394940.1 hypothetical protein MCOR20_010373 [Pyricularia oryzae]
MGETRWVVEVRPGEKVSLNGTIESVYAQLLELNRSYETDNGEQISARLAKLDQEIAAIKEKRLQRRHGWSTVPLVGGRRDLCYDQGRLPRYLDRNNLDRGLRLLTRQLLVELGHWMVQLRNFDEFNRLSKV